MKKLVMILLAIAPMLTAIGSDYFLGLPIHSPEYAPIGRKEFIKGEYVTWEYPFPWRGTLDDGSAIQITRDQALRFISFDQGSKVIEFQLSDGERLRTIHPPNTFFNRIVSLRSIQAIGLEREILINRIGQPQKEEKLSGGGSVLKFSREVTTERNGVDYLTSRTSGNFSGYGYSEKTVTEVPYTETITFNPYSFKVTISSDGKVTQIEDLCTKSASWEKN